MRSTPIPHRHTLALVVTLAAVALAGCAAPLVTDPTPDRRHATTTATVSDGNLTVTLDALNQADRVRITTADGLPADPRAEQHVATLSDPGATVTIPMNQSTSVIVRSVTGDEVRVTNVYRRHINTGTLVDLHGYTPYPDRSGTAVANVAIDNLTTTENQTTYRFEWVWPTAGLGTPNLYTHGVMRADSVELEVRPEAHSAIPRYTTALDSIGDTHRITANVTHPVQVTVIGVYNGQKNVLATVTLPETACSLNDTAFDTNGEAFDREHCRITAPPTNE